MSTLLSVQATIQTLWSQIPDLREQVNTDTTEIQVDLWQGYGGPGLGHTFVDPGGKKRRRKGELERLEGRLKWLEEQELSLLQAAREGVPTRLSMIDRQIADLTASGEPTHTLVRERGLIINKMKEYGLAVPDQ